MHPGATEPTQTPRPDHGSWPPHAVGLHGARLTEPSIVSAIDRISEAFTAHAINYAAFAAEITAVNRTLSKLVEEHETRLDELESARTAADRASMRKWRSRFWWLFGLLIAASSALTIDLARQALRSRGILP